MSIADKLTTIAQNEQRVFDAGEDAANRRYWSRFWNGLYNPNTGSANLRAAFAGGGWNDETFSKIIYPTDNVITVTGSSTGQYMFYFFNRDRSTNTELIDLSEFCNRINTSNMTNAAYMFLNARVKNVTVDLGNCTTIQYAFNCDNGGFIENLTLKVTSACTSYLNAFANMYYTKEIRFTDDSEIAANISFAQSNSLSDASIDSIINALGTVSKTQTLTVHSSVYSRMVEDGKDVLVTAKNWTLVKG